MPRVESDSDTIFVSSISFCDGLLSPDGWLCAITTLTALFFLPGTVGDNEVEGFAVFFSDFEYGLLYGFVPKLGFDAPMDDD